MRESLKALLHLKSQDYINAWLNQVNDTTLSNDYNEQSYIGYLEFFSFFLRKYLFKNTLDREENNIFAVSERAFNEKELYINCLQGTHFKDAKNNQEMNTILLEDSTLLSTILSSFEKQQIGKNDNIIFCGCNDNINIIADILRLTWVVPNKISLIDYEGNIFRFRPFEDVCHHEITFPVARAVLAETCLAHDVDLIKNFAPKINQYSNPHRKLVEKVKYRTQIDLEISGDSVIATSQLFLGRDLPKDVYDWHISELNCGHLNLRNLVNTYASSEEYRLNSNINMLKRYSPKPVVPEGQLSKALFEKNDQPRVTILIPVYGSLDFTLQCLLSIYENKPKCSFEVLVVDDNSPDNSFVELEKINGIRLVRNEKNLGFLRSVNNAIKSCNGDYIYLLNNDTIVMPGFLDELLSTFDKRQDAGIVGSKLIYSEGLLQESGCIIAKDSSIQPLGRGQNPLLPEYNYLREVDFCSGASLLIRKDVFIKIGGFDDRYAPAYFEDPDLSFEVRKLGLKTYVNPQSKIIHYESISHGEEKYQVQDRINRPKFIEKWKEVLDLQRYPTISSFSHWDDKSEKIALYLDCILPEIDLGAGGIDAFYFNESLIEQGYHTIFFAEHNPTYRIKYTDILQRIGVEVIYNPWHALEDYLSIIGSKIKLVVVARIYQLLAFKPLIQKYCKNAKVIFNTVDIHFLREEREAILENNGDKLQRSKITKHNELDAIQNFADKTIVIGSQEKEMLETDFNCSNVFHIPLMRDIPGRAESKNRSNIIFIGSAHQPNYDAVIYLYSEILPLLKEAKITNQINIIGGPLKEALSGDPLWNEIKNESQLNFCGFIEDLEEIFSESLLMICPLRYGSGVKGKVATAMGYGVPVISSEIGVEGTGLINNEHILVAHSSDDYINHIKNLSSDSSLWSKLSNNSLKFMEENFSIKSGKEKFTNLVNNLMTE